MSDTTGGKPKFNLSETGSLIVSLFLMAIFAGITVLTYLAKDVSSFQLIVGSAVAGMATVSGYWLGSSRGSSKKDDVISAIAAQPSTTINNTAQPGGVVSPMGGGT